MEFFEEDEPPDSPDEPRRRSSRGRRSGGGDDGGEGGHPSRQQILTRQLTLAGVSIVVLILIFLAFRGCLDARKERGFQNYVSDLTALTGETAQLSDTFFAALNGESEEGSVDLQNEVNSARGQAEGQLDRAEGLDAPDEVAGAQTQTVLSYRFRADALDVIAEQLGPAEGNQGSEKAINQITKQMEVLLTSDVLYEMARAEIEQTVSDEGIALDSEVPKSKFLPTGDSDPNYLDPNEIAVLIGNAGGSSSGGGGMGADCDPGDDLSHGLGLISTTALPSNVVLEPGVTATVSADGLEFVISVQNQGGADESNIKVALGGDFSGNQTINSIAAGETQDVTIVPNSPPGSGEAASLEVTVDTVCGEGVAENNTATYELSLE